MPATYSVETAGDIALTAATAKSIMSVIRGANLPVRIVELSVSFDGTSASNEPVTIELMSSTEATAGTASGHTIAQVGGVPATPSATAKRNYTVEPTVLTTLARWLVHPQAGIVLQWPLGREPEQATASDALVVRVTAPANVNAQGYLWFEEG
jgi:hypothetical protein